MYEDSASERDRLSVFSIVDLQLSGPISNHSGMTHLPEMIAHLDIDLPSCQDSLFGGLSKVKKLAWWVLFSNSAASFSVGLTIAGAMHFALYEVRSICYTSVSSWVLGNCNYDSFSFPRNHSPDRRLHTVDEEWYESVAGHVR